MSTQISVSELERLTGKDRRDIRKQLDGLGFVVGDKNAKLYDSKIALERIYQKTHMGTVEEQQALARLDYERIRAAKLETEHRTLLGRLVEIDSIAPVVEREYAAVRAGFLAMGTRICLDLVNMNSPIEIKSRIDDEVNTVLSELSNGSDIQGQLSSNTSEDADSATDDEG